jgi:hypothetical protein
VMEWRRYESKEQYRVETTYPWPWPDSSHGETKTSTDPRIHQRWDQMSRKSKHPLPNPPWALCLDVCNMAHQNSIYCHTVPNWIGTTYYSYSITVPSWCRCSICREVQIYFAPIFVTKCAIQNSNDKCLK